MGRGPAVRFLASRLSRGELQRPALWPALLCAALALRPDRGHVCHLWPGREVRRDSRATREGPFCPPLLQNTRAPSVFKTASLFLGFCSVVLVLLTVTFQGPLRKGEILFYPTLSLWGRPTHFLMPTVRFCRGMGSLGTRRAGGESMGWGQDGHPVSASKPILSLGSSLAHAS